ncbi:hypothetical protein Leryth_006683 [Lithospermum erythrorhizon]|nr:hypothetical protein Leryth_006683 [Lithospermum erythrorhizon]
MALARNHRLDDSDMCLKPLFSYYENDNDFGGSPPSIHGSDQSSPHQNSNKIRQGSNSLSPIKNSSCSSPSSSNSSGLVYPTLKYHQNDNKENSIFGFKSGYGNSSNAHTCGSLLSFGQNEQFHQNSFPRINNQEDVSIWEDNMHHRNNHVSLENGNGVQFGWMNLESTASPHSGISDLGRKEDCLNKRRPCEEESAQLPNKKQCGSPTKQTKLKASSPSKDPQSLAAKNRRERISERLKTLQELVPNGSKVDLVTKAISYVKFLQLQVKILASDEFWPVQGGKAPELSKVQDAIDTILASQRDRNSSSK